MRKSKSESINLKEVVPRTKTEKLLLKTCIKLEKILSMMPGHIYWVDRNGVYLGCNDKQAESAGLSSRDKIIGKRNKDLPWNYSSNFLPEKLDTLNLEVMETRKERTAEEPAVLKDGTKAVFLSHKVPIYNEEGEVEGLVGISIDITEEKNLQSEIKEMEFNKKIKEEKIKVVEAIGSSIAHEMRTPLRSIILNLIGIEKYLPILLEGYNLSKKNKTTLKEIPQSRLNLLNETILKIKQEAVLSNALIDMFLIKIKNPEIQEENLSVISIKDCINEAIKRYPFQSSEKKLINWDKKDDFHFKGERLMVVHILFNLIKNALYYVRAAGKGKIYISIKKKRKELVFEDTGQGIPQKILPKIFNYFFSKSRSHAGIGLSFCKLAMRTIGGEIVCHSVEGKYTRFILFFPERNELNY